MEWEGGGGGEAEEDVVASGEGGYLGEYRGGEIL